MADGLVISLHPLSLPIGFIAVRGLYPSHPTFDNLYALEGMTALTVFVIWDCRICSGPPKVEFSQLISS